MTPHPHLYRACIHNPLLPENHQPPFSECMFLRCWWYYRLNILYNGVPYYKNPIKDIDEAKLARSTQDEVWGYIVDDLTSCINNPDLPDK